MAQNVFGDLGALQVKVMRQRHKIVKSERPNTIIRS